MRSRFAIESARRVHHNPPAAKWHSPSAPVFDAVRQPSKASGQGTNGLADWMTEHTDIVGNVSRVRTFPTVDTLNAELAHVQAADRRFKTRADRAAARQTTLPPRLVSNGRTLLVARVTPSSYPVRRNTTATPVGRILSKPYNPGIRTLDALHARAVSIPISHRPVEVERVGQFIHEPAQPSAPTIQERLAAFRGR